MDEVRFGVIGCGVIGRVHAANIASQVPGARLVAVADINRGAAEACARECAVEPAGNDATLLARADIDAVAICTPPETHGAIIEAAARAGKQIFCEKPLERTLSEADRGLAAVAATEVKLFVAFNRRFDPHFGSLYDAVRAGKIGRPLTAHLVAWDPIQPPGAPHPPGDIFVNSAIHELDLAPYLMGVPVESVHVTGAVMDDRVDPPVDDPDTAVTTLHFANGTSATVSNSRISGHGYDQRMEVFGTTGVLTAGNQRLDDLVVTDASGQHRAPVQPFFVQRYHESYVAEMREFVKCLRNETPVPVGGREARAALVLALAADRSYRESRVVPVSEFPAD
ncbi:MAG: Gfo/Idh/MocA family oxidoreductase [Dehalococcoidia bacterium]